MENSKNNKKLFVISGSSGVGKGTLISGFLERNPDFKLSISYTTRAKRDGEEDEINYFFRTKEEFTNSIKNDEFLEWAEFSGNYYGTKRKFVEKTLFEGSNLLLEIETNGAFQIKEKMPEAVLIFIAPPSYEDLENRLRNRNTETEDAIKKRLECVQREKECSKNYDYIIINDKLEDAILELEKIIKEKNA